MYMYAVEKCVLTREQKKPAGISTLPVSVLDNKKIRRCFDRILTSPLNLGIFSKINDRFRAELPQVLERLVSLTEFSFDLRGFCFPASGDQLTGN